MQEVVVQKYGGSSIATLERMRVVARHVKQTADEGKRVIVVVSAMGDGTDKLLQLAEEISGGPPRDSERDKLLVTGEEQSAALLAMALCALGLDAVSLNGLQVGLETDPGYGKAKIRGVRNLQRVRELLDSNKVVVVPGFQGVIEGTDEMVTLGRGGSDLTAIALAGALGLNSCEIYTDVDGVYTVDPRLVPGAKRFDRITYGQMLELSGAGAGVLMDRCVLLAQNFGVEITTLLSPSFGKSTGGTLVCSGSTLENMETRDWVMPGIAIGSGIALLKISGAPNQPGVAAKVFGALSPINVIDTAQGQGEENVTISVLCGSRDLGMAVEAIGMLKGITVTHESGMIALTLVYPLMKEEHGYLHRVCRAIGKARVNIEMLSSSGTTVLAVVKEEGLVKAARALGEEFQLIVRTEATT